MSRTPSHYRAALRVDRHALDDALERQADDFGEIGLQLVRAEARADALAADAKRAEAQALVDVRGRQDKITVAEQEAAVRLHPRVVAAQDAARRAAEDAAEWRMLHVAWKERGYAIKGLAELYAANYFTASSHSMPRAREDRDAGHMEARERMRAAREGRAAHRALESIQEAGGTGQRRRLA